MTHTTTLTRADGSRIWIEVTFGHKVLRGEPDYNFMLYKCAPGKRKFVKAVNTDNWEFRCIPFAEQPAELLRLQLAYVTPAEILAAKLELWQKIKPTI